jgi:hypothetical protein
LTRISPARASDPVMRRTTTRLVLTLRAMRRQVAGPSASPDASPDASSRT